MLADEHVAKEMGVKAVPVETTWATCVLDLQASKADVQFGLQATPKRALEIDFAGPLYNLLVPQASNGGGPFPAVVVLHGCIGITGHFTGIADRRSSWGYVALAVDSLGPRGLADRSGVGLSIRRSMPMRRCATWRSCISSIRRGSPFSAIRGAVLPCSTPSIATRRRNTSPSGFAPRSPITPPVTSRRQR
jgi:hypothetical protein